MADSTNESGERAARAQEFPRSGNLAMTKSANRALPGAHRRTWPRFATTAIGLFAAFATAGGCFHNAAVDSKNEAAEELQTESTPPPSAERSPLDDADWLAGGVPAAESAEDETSTPEGRRSLMRRALSRLHQGQHEEAEHDLWRLSRSYKEIADYIDYFRLKALAERGERDNALGFSRVFRFEHPKSLVLGEVLAIRARLLSESGDYPEELSVIERALAKDLVDGKDALLLLKAQAIEAQGDIPGSLELYREVRKRYPRRASGKAARARIDYLEATNPALRPERTVSYLKAEVRTLRAEGRWNAAAGVYDELAGLLAGRGELASIVLSKAEMLRRIGDKRRALELYARIAEQWPATAWARDALYQIARIHWNDDQDALALEKLRLIVRKYASFGRLDDVWYMAGRIYLTAGDEHGAIENLSRLAAHGEGERAIDGAWLLGWLHYQRGRYREARTAFEQLARAGAGGPYTPKGLYWKAISALKAGESDEGLAELEQLGRRYAGTYYAHLARLRLEKARNLAADAFSIAAGADQVDAEVLGFIDYLDRPDLLEDDGWAPRIRAAEELHAVGLEEWAAREIRVIENTSRGDLRVRYQIARLYQDAGSYLASVRVANKIEWDLRRRGVSVLPRALLELQYPLAYWETITTVAESWRVDPFLVAALIRQESVFNPQARSPANAMGLMQLLPKTGRQVAQDLGRWPFRSDLLYVPDINIALGVPYFAGLLDRNGGSHVRALAAYNAGEKALAKWVERAGDRPDDEFIETISYPETNDYVKLILRNRYNYAAIYREEARMRSAFDQPVRVAFD
ncbi:MAG: transglycosylase SLT domain-containing protein [Myxococcales bacterium]|nr:transglycosylase SLT domain-containing protein [Myxococcales bacterium]